MRDLPPHCVSLNRFEIKIFCLPRRAGPGECGKSTIVKQMKIIHGEGYSAEERKSFVPLIHQNIIDATATLLRAMQALDIPIGTAANQVIIHSRPSVITMCRRRWTGFLHSVTSWTRRRSTW